MRSLAQLALISLASAAAISPGAYSPDSPYPTPNFNPNLNFTSTTSTTSTDLNLTRRRTDTGKFTPLFPPSLQPSFCPYDTINQPQPLLSYDATTAPLASDCGHIIDFIIDNNKQGYWTYDVTDLERKEGIVLMYYKTCAFKLVSDDGRVLVGAGGDGKDGNKKSEQFRFGVEELKFYLGTWLEKQRHGRLGAKGVVDCWSEGVEKKDMGGVGVRWSVEAVMSKSVKPMLPGTG
ncbi:hypothetical protein SMACR_08981 [Sordaria macrospora]|uniref:WGS project CABT00000000 data, contig 2.31 n=2 Tax=Sordaria macrospora TaxID=5147 RepID=F7W5T5_SORMK|nr:uncharacterized protein SMAC_08981 [Sordaria macrospora k-hell]KAA8635547.1 hypothetical protein SMACR_08981 [Sordaria macrospora]KAH7629495.1 hypothetical protein B0T09DRAFT_410055 [Sordaria sp. MPI-SDFR-AT-0083]WPJ66291.1 hypothetical protein SMAC4_08981 [Sordaria macrospora]CCC12873.1 unnamed protein product [Sordaria macrospora k-hell]